jgi:hypothetical protein
MESNILTHKQVTNLITNKITNYFEVIEPQNLSQIWVTYVGKFYIVTGKTNISTPVNIGELINDYLKNFYIDDWNPINVLDLLEYEYPMELERNISFNFDRQNEIFDFTEIHEVQIDNNNSFDEPVVSDSLFGSSLYFEKMYYSHFAKISNHLFASSFCNEVRLNLYLHKDQEPTFVMESNEWLPSYQHAFNVVDATFSHDPKDIIEKTGLTDFDFEDLILNKEDYPWNKKNRLKDFMMI